MCAGVLEQHDPSAVAVALPQREEPQLQSSKKALPEEACIHHRAVGTEMVRPETGMAAAWH